jgi:hypothetical protein
MVRVCAERAATKELEYEALRIKYENLVDRWNDLVEKVNKKGGQPFLESDGISQLIDRDDLKTLITLCHPDKHGGKQSANDITQKLLSLRNMVN